MDQSTDKVYLDFPPSGGKAKDFQISHSAATPLMVELNFLRNHSGIIKDKVKAQAALVRERANHLQLKMQVKQKKTITDAFQSKIETLKTEKIKLQGNKTSLGRTDFHSVVNDNIQGSIYEGLLENENSLW